MKAVKKGCSQLPISPSKSKGDFNDVFFFFPRESLEKVKWSAGSC